MGVCCKNSWSYVDESLCLEILCPFLGTSLVSHFIATSVKTDKRTPPPSVKWALYLNYNIASSISVQMWLSFVKDITIEEVFVNQTFLFCSLRNSYRVG